MLDFNRYIHLLSNLRRGNYRGRFSNAKPVFILTIIDLIENNYIKENSIIYNAMIENFFKINLWKYDNDNNSVAIMPFFHLNKESFYHIKWKEGKEITSYSRTPSAKYLRENVEYAKLDDELWHILMDT